MRSICNFGYARSRKGGTHFPDVRGLLKYVQYVRQEAQRPYVERDDASAVAPPLSSTRRD
jgi:uncharacterized protein YfdQ (DUF2303 family)